MKSIPRVSVLMPVYNAEKYIAQAIESILGQSFDDFEFIIVNDGSTDKSLGLISKYAKRDPRIRIVSQENSGVGASLIEAVALANGEYIARMDADDVSLPNRLARECQYLDSHPKCAVVASVVQPIGANGEFLEFWPPDKETVSYKDIRDRLPIENCLAHPSVMVRSQVLKKFNYIESQVPSEDYDLWLRLIAADYQIHKIDEPLFLYRMHSNSITQSYNQQFSVNRKMLRVKYKFLLGQLKRRRFGYVERKVFISATRLFLYLLFRKSENILWKIFVAPFKPTMHSFDKLLRVFRRPAHIIRLAANRLSLLWRLRTQYDNPTKFAILFIVPWFGIGGAEKILLDIITGLNERGYQIYCVATVDSRNEWKDLYAHHCIAAIDLDAIAMDGNKAWFLKKFVLSKNISTVITTNNYPGYDAARLIKKARPDVKILDILHGQGGKKEGGGWPFFSTPYDKCLDKRVVVSEYLRDYLVRQHKINVEKIKVIHNGVAPFQGPIPDAGLAMKTAEGKFIVLWAGRFSYEKHPELALKTARIVRGVTEGVHFVLVGDGEMRTELGEMVDRLNLQDAVTLAEEPYNDPRTYMSYADVLLMSSEMEGLPVVILEAFATKLPVIAPRVGGIPEIVKDLGSGYLINLSAAFPEKAAEKILRLSKNKGLASRLGKAGYATVQSEYSLDRMIYEYEKVLNEAVVLH
ncbi:MAG: glycosyltransferase [Candidatus Saccharimonadales bacterium]